VLELVLGATGRRNSEIFGSL